MRTTSKALLVFVALLVVHGTVQPAVGATSAKHAARGKAQHRGSVEGDVYLTMQSGDVKKGAGLTVRLLDNADQVFSAISERCDAWKKYLASTPGDYNDHLAKGPGLENDLSTIISNNVISETGTGMNAHYKFENLLPGKYLLFAVFPIGDNNYRWLIPVEIRSGRSATVDLDTEKENRAVIGCGWN